MKNTKKKKKRALEWKVEAAENQSEGVTPLLVPGD